MSGPGEKPYEYRTPTPESRRLGRELQALAREEQAAKQEEDGFSSLPAAGQFFRHFQTGEIVQVIFLAEDVTKAIPHLSVVFVPVSRRVERPTILRLVNFGQGMAPGLSRYNRCGRDGSPLTGSA